MFSQTLPNCTKVEAGQTVKAWTGEELDEVIRGQVIYTRHITHQLQHQHFLLNLPSGLGIPDRRLRNDIADHEPPGLRTGQASGHPAEALRPSQGKTRHPREYTRFNTAENSSSTETLLHPIQGQVTHDMIIELPYMEQIIQETLRLHPILYRYPLNPLIAWPNQSLTITGLIQSQSKIQKNAIIIK